MNFKTDDEQVETIYFHDYGSALQENCKARFCPLKI
jgi:hypothetical protein